MKSLKRISNKRMWVCEFHRMSHKDISWSDGKLERDRDRYTRSNLFMSLKFDEL